MFIICLLLVTGIFVITIYSMEGYFLILAASNFPFLVTLSTINKFLDMKRMPSL